GEAERGVAVGRHAVRLRGIRSHELADAGEIAGRGGLEHVELRPAAKDRHGNLVPAAVQRGKDGGEALLITRVDQPSIRLEESFDRRPVAAFNRGEQIGRHLGPPWNSLALLTNITACPDAQVELASARSPTGCTRPRSIFCGVRAGPTRSPGYRLRSSRRSPCS